FFFQAEDGIRDKLVTGVQTCALPISGVMVAVLVVGQRIANGEYHRAAVTEVARIQPTSRLLTDMLGAQSAAEGYVATLEPSRLRSEERRVGKEWRGWRAADG